MKIDLIASTGNFKTKEEFLRFSQICARQCYSGKSYEELTNEPENNDLIDRALKSGHHSVFEHIGLTFSMDGIPKSLAMVFNNEKQYVTSEKSARYTQMNDLIPEQKEKYDKWMNILIPEIDKIYPVMKDSEKRDTAIKKLAQENARYMTSVFTPTKMIHTLNLRQLNFLIYEFDNFIKENKNGSDLFKKKLINSMNEFLKQTNEFKIKDLQNQTDRKLSLFGESSVEEYFGDDNYSTNYFLSFAGLAQAHRHRTIDYQILSGTCKGAVHGFFIPHIIRKSNSKLVYEWNNDLNEISKTDFPQAQLVYISERGSIDDFRSKAILRLCGHAQHEIMKNTKITAEKFIHYREKYSNAISPKCQQGIKCAGSCIWTGKKALDRLV